MTSTQAPVRWGIAGTGRIAQQFVEGLRTVPDAEVVAIGSRTPGRAGAVAEALGIPRAHDTRAELFADDDVDVVYVAGTADEHHAATVAALAAGRHVLCEKPLALSLGQATAMVDAARAADRFLMEAMWSRFLPVYLRLGEVLAAGRIGRPLVVEADFSFRVPTDDVAEHRLFDLSRGGGALLDLGVYPLNLAAMVLGEPDRIAAVGTIGTTGVDERTAVVLGYPDGAVARLGCSIRTSGTCSARIAGEQGTITIDPFMHAPTTLRVDTAEGTEVIEAEPPSLAHQVPEVHRCLRAGELESPTMPWSASLAMARICDEVGRQIGLRHPDG